MASTKPQLIAMIRVNRTRCLYLCCVRKFKENTHWTLR